MGGGIIHRVRGEDLIAVVCPNIAIVRLRERLRAIDPRLLKVGHEARTPLYQRGEIDRTVDNLFFERTHWKTVLRHLKWIVACKDIFARVTTDRALIDVYVGSRSIKNRLKSQLELGEEGELLITNSIEDLLAGPDLAIIRLGEVIHLNKAAANVLHEALLLRRGQGKPTWLVEPPGAPFGGMVCCNDDVLALVNEFFESIHLPAQRGDEDRPGVTIDEEAGEVTVDGPSDLNETLPEEQEDEVLEPPAPHRGSRTSPQAMDEQSQIDSLMGPSRKYRPGSKRF